MDAPDSSSFKKQRNAKIRRDKRKNTFSKNNSGNTAPDSELTQNPSSTPQPQRANNRQTNESSPDSELTQNTASTPQPQRANNRQRDEITRNRPNAAEESTKGVTQAEVKEITMIDHSNLKRETEEIAKLTKKFSKREVTSNWHRYAAEENASVDRLEEEAPADFTDLLQVPVSRGGYLQLKEEQEWSSAVPRSHWALDLKQLSFSLACIPTHERLRLPLEKLADEEIQRYLFLAEEAKSYYDACEGADLKDDVGYKEKPFNILDVERSTNTLVNMDLHLEKSLNNTPVSKMETLEKGGLNVNKKVTLNIEQDVMHENNKEIHEINDSLNSKQVNASNKVNSGDSSLLVNTNNKPTIEVAPHDKLESKNVITNQQTSSENDAMQNKINGTKPDLPTQIVISDLERDNTSKTVTECNIDQINNYEIKEKRERRNNNRKSPMKEEIESKTAEKVNEIKFEDDDDLDFLLSLKKPITSEKKNESKPAVLKDSSFLPGATVTPSSTTAAQHTDLDDWLDSVLED